MHRQRRFERAPGERALVLTAVVALATAWLGLRGAPAHAQQACTPDMTEQQQKDSAVAWWRQGTRLFEEQRYQEAIERYQHAYDCTMLLPPSDKVTKTAANFVFNIAQARRQLGACRAAIQGYRRYLRMTAGFTDDKEVREVRTAVAVTLDELEKTCREPPAPDETSPPEAMRPPGQIRDRDAAAPRGQEPRAAQRAIPTTGPTSGVGVGATRERREAGDRGAARRPERVAMSVGIGRAFFNMRGLDDKEYVTLALRAGYPMRLGRLGVEAGAAATFTPIEWTADFAGTEGTASLWSILLNAGTSYPILDRLSARADLGLGVLAFSGLGMFNPFTDGYAASAPLFMFHVRAELGATYAITPNLVVSASPLVFAYSPVHDDLNELVRPFTRWELMIGAGFRR